MILTYDDNLSPGRRRFYQFSFFLCLVRIIVSMFRGAMAGTLIAILIATIFVESARRWKWVRSLLVSLLVAAAIMTALVMSIPPVRAVFNVALLGRLKLAINAGSGGGSLEFRQLETEVAMEDIREDPIIGHGPGSMITKHFDPLNYARVELYLHSGFVWYWYKLGILGIATVLAFFIGIYGTCLRLLRRKLHPPDRGWVIGTLAATIAMLPVIHTNNMLIRSQGAYAMTLLLFGLCMIALKYRDIPRDQLPPINGEVAQ
jgi:O-antigen ligase